MSTYKRIKDGNVAVEYTSHSDIFSITVDDETYDLLLDESEWESLCAIIEQMNEFLNPPIR